MTSISELLDSVHDLGASVVRLSPDRVIVIDRRSVVPVALCAELRARKADILAHLTPHPCVGCGSFAFRTPGTRCYWCRTGAGGDR
jgi:hypothetical protein